MHEDTTLASDIISEWDENAEVRHRQITSKIDLSYHKILIPTILKLVGNLHDRSVIDVGCGSGYLTAKLAVKASHTVGVDPSKKMIEIANREYGQIPSLEFHNLSIKNFSHQNPHKQFEVAISNMSLITIPHLDEAVEVISSLLVPEGIFVFNITHPCFYNQYRKYESQESFQYNVPHPQKGDFLISLDKRGLKSTTTHFHRPLQKYFQSLRNASFIIDRLVEPFPKPEAEKRYPEHWKVPHFLSMRCVKLKCGSKAFFKQT